MSLLVDIATSALDPSYAAAAAAHGAAGHPPRRGAVLLTAAGVIAATLLVAIAALQARNDAPAVSRSRDALLGQVDGRNRAISGLQRQVDALRRDSTGLRDQLLASTRAGEALTGRLAAAELDAGTVPVTGPGLRVQLDDAPSGGPDNRVLDHDVQAVVNGLWGAGAEAISVNGQRLTSETAIRQAGGTILVNFQPVSAPYVILAVGNPVGVETAFAAGTAAARMRNLGQLYGIRFTYARTDKLELPAASGLTLRHATPGTGAQS